jgi:hypothetical protein
MGQGRAQQRRMRRERQRAVGQAAQALLLDAAAQASQAFGVSSFSRMGMRWALLVVEWA